MPRDGGKTTGAQGPAVRCSQGDEMPIQEENMPACGEPSDAWTAVRLRFFSSGQPFTGHPPGTSLLASLPEARVPLHIGAAAERGLLLWDSQR